MPETHQPIIVIILIIYSVYLLKNSVELKEYILGRIASYLFQFLRKLHSFLSAGLKTVELDCAFFYVPRPLIDRAPGNDVTSLTTYTRVGDTGIYIYIVQTRG